MMGTAEDSRGRIWRKLRASAWELGESLATPRGTAPDRWTSR